MKLFAQQGALEGERIATGLGMGVIEGVILSPRDVSLPAMAEKIARYRAAQPDCEILFDPQLYAAFSPSEEGHKLGYLLDDYADYFKPCRKNQLVREDAVKDLLRRAIEFQSRLPGLSAITTPNIIIPRSLDSVETVIASNFIRLARAISLSQGVRLPVYATLAVSREALFKEQEVVEFVNELTALDEPPDGFYVLVAGRSQDVRTEIFNADIIAAWMYLNYALSLNGFRVVNGYSDIVAPFLRVAQGSVAASGWWANLRSFTIERFQPNVGGGRLPIQRYLSCSLLNRITFYELAQLRAVAGILNGLPTDQEFPPPECEPARNKEVLQSWEALREVLKMVESKGDEPTQMLRAATGMLDKAQALYDRIEGRYDLDPKSNSDHIPALRDGIALFGKLAELGLG